MMIPKVSVIVPNYNHREFLTERLESIMSQSFQDFELILLDDRSTDGSEEILKRYKDHPKVSHCIINEQNSGSPFQQWKKGINLAKGEYIWMAESDDYCEPNFLEHIFESISPNMGIYYVQTIDVDSKGMKLGNRISYTREFQPNIWKKDFSLGGIEFINNYLVVKNVIPNASAVVFKRDLLGDNFFSDELLKMRMCGDWMFWIRLCKKTNIGFSKTPLNYFRHHEGMTRNHSNSDTRKNRILEELTVRKYLVKTFQSRDEKRERKLHRKWFNLHPVTAVFDSQFYRGRMPHEGILTFAARYLIWRWKKRSA
jgi:glycosyltransferase involved in cell wall biosynthesis